MRKLIELEQCAEPRPNGRLRWRVAEYKTNETQGIDHGKVTLKDTHWFETIDLAYDHIRDYLIAE